MKTKTAHDIASFLTITGKVRKLPKRKEVSKQRRKLWLGKTAF